MFILVSIVWLILLVVCVNSATKNAYADGYDLGYLAGANGWKRHSEPPKPELPKLVQRTPMKSTITSDEIDEFLNRERIKI